MTKTPDYVTPIMTSMKLIRELVKMAEKTEKDLTRIRKELLEMLMNDERQPGDKE